MRELAGSSEIESAAEHFEDLVENASHKGPQAITRNGEALVCVMDAGEVMDASEYDRRCATLDFDQGPDKARRP